MFLHYPFSTLNFMVRLVFSPTFHLLRELRNLLFWFTENLSWQNVCCEEFCCWCSVFCFPLSTPSQQQWFYHNLFLHSYQFYLSPMTWLFPRMPVGLRVQSVVMEHGGFKQPSNKGHEKPERSGSGTSLPAWLWINYLISVSSTVG